MADRDYASELAAAGRIDGYPLKCDKRGAYGNPCQGTTARIVPNAGHMQATCETCGNYVKHVPGHALGLKQRRVRSRPDISPGTRSAVLDACSHRCVYCGRAAPDVILHVGHILSVEEGREIGATDAELYSVENLWAECEECNLGHGSRSAHPRDFARNMHLLIRARIAAGAR